MFFTVLQAIYNDSIWLSNNYPFEEYYPLLRGYLSDELAIHSKYMSPYRFSYKYRKPVEQVIKFFLALTGDDGIFSLRFKFICENDDCINIFQEKDISNNRLYCKDCGEEYNFEKVNADNEISLLFVLNEDLKVELSKDIFFEKSSSYKTEACLNEDSSRGELLLKKAAELLREEPINDSLEKNLERLAFNSNV
ncbi:hypothetical protein J9537_10540 [Enterococcus raffinosus]|uniref:hypothetical protein n=1 Tax=Enterococcus raffinosus TaxID=71452 RepID=UPI001C45BA9F|nr:hypothetical protein [Enterococcus raffinosus]QXJ58456.1 hypothetical protein J9537_10540 [Enterococcus raffinosus]